MRCYAIALAVMLLGVPLGAQNTLRPATDAFSGRIVDHAGGAIKAFVLIHSDRAGNPTNATVPVSVLGEFRIDLRPGLYDLFVAAPGYRPIAKVIEIKVGKPIATKMTMELDQEHSGGIPY